MTAKGVKRKLSAILSADVEGYSRLMREDEVATVQTLKDYQRAMSAIIQKHRGRVVDSPGDNVLAEFPSVVDSVNCAVEIQRELAERNTQLPENRRMEFRIGVNLGDVIDEEERIYGDGVNVAARLEGLSDAGGICISGTAFDHVRNKLSVGYEYLGEQTVKNIPEPVRVYRVLMEPEGAGKLIGEKRAGLKRWQWVMALVVVVAGAVFAIWKFYLRPPPMEVASVERMAYPLPDKPSIAVLPLENLSGDPEHEHFSDGLTEEIITALSKIPKMFVIARNSTFTYKGKPVKVQQVAEELGVRYVLEGMVRIAGDRMRITVQLIDAMTGNHLWAERYDRELKDIFALQDDITKEVMTALQVKLTTGEQARVYGKGTDKLEAYLKLLQGREHYRRGTKEDNILARRIFEEVIALDPKYAIAYRFLSGTHHADLAFGTSKSPKQSIARAIELAKRAIAIDDSLAEAHGFLGFLYTLTGQYEKGIKEAERAVALDPNSADAHIQLGAVLHNAGRREEAIPIIKRAIRLNPFPPLIYFLQLGETYRSLGRYEEAIAAYKMALQRNPDFLGAHITLAAIYSMTGKKEQAREAAEEVLRIDPNFSLDSFAKRRKKLIRDNKTEMKLFIDALRKAGLPEHPPLPLPDKPSIAVLPFTNMSDDPKQEFFSDGLSEEIITALSKTPKLFVIARNSSFTYKEKPVKVQQVGRDLGVRYVLEGSVRTAGDRVRVTAQLVNATTGNYVWAERYDRDLKDIFALQDEITMKVITELQVKLTEAEQARLLAKGTDNLGAYIKLLEGREHVYRMNKEDNALARQLFQEAIALDPEYPKPYAFLATTHLLDIWFGSSKSPRESLAKAIELAQKAIALDDCYATAHGLLGHLYVYTRQYDKAIAECERGVALDPNSASALAWLGTNLYWSDSPQQAIPVLEKAIRLNPIPPSWYLNNLAMAYRDTGRHEEAISACKKVLHREPKNVIARLVLAATYSFSGREEEARAEAAEILRIDPKFSLERLAKTRPHKNQANTERFIDSLRKAGLK